MTRFRLSRFSSYRASRRSLYQVVWQRMLAIFSGTDVYSFTIIVAAFMAGLGIGHLSGGQLPIACSRRTNILLFAASELAIALFSFFSRGLYYDLLYQRLGPLSIAPGHHRAHLVREPAVANVFHGHVPSSSGEGADTGSSIARLPPLARSTASTRSGPRQGRWSPPGGCFRDSASMAACGSEAC